MIDKKIKELKEANLGNIVDVLVDIIKYQDERISELEKIEKSKYELGCTIQNDHIFSIKDVECNSVDVEIQDYNDSIISEDFIRTEVIKITNAILNKGYIGISCFYYIHNCIEIQYIDGYGLRFCYFTNNDDSIDCNNIIKLINGKVEIELCEAMNNISIKNEMKSRLSNLSQHLLKLGYPNLS